MKNCQQLILAALLSTLCITSPSVVAGSHDEAASVLQQSLAAVIGDSELPESLTAKGGGKAFGFPANFELLASQSGHIALNAESVQYNLYRVSGPDRGWERQSWQNLGESSPPRVRELGPRAQSRSRPWFLYALATYAGAPQFCRIKPSPASGQELAVKQVDCANGESTETFLIDAQSFLPVERRYQGDYAEGRQVVIELFGNYKQSDGYTLPYHLVIPGPELPRTTMEIEVEGYQFANLPATADFAYPNATQQNTAYEVNLQNVPYGVYKEADWLQGSEDWDQNSRWSTVFAPTETWTFDMMVSEVYGRWLDPLQVRALLKAGDEVVSEVVFNRALLEKMRRRNVSRYAGLAGNFVLRHHFTAPADVGVDSMHYEMTLAAPDGRIVTTGRNIAVTNYQQKTEMIFPVKGHFIITSGHDWNDINHKDEWQQWGALDIVPMSDELALLNTPHDGEEEFNESFIAYGRDIIAPAAGLVVYARDGVPDKMPDDFWQTTNLSVDVWALPGNVVIIDHGNNEFSFFAHLLNGKLKVKVGDWVEQGQMIALLGASNGGFPHLHYQLMAGSTLLRSDGLPSKFENLRHGIYPQLRVAMPKRGFHLYAE